ncbi:ABC transporter ATP-binding protein [Propioniciclava sinopodophylli]|uniref:ABC transporter ATP-binding protein n=1 Tax=Propioniciclava sinopodophylli TaxID=1837344 RepID=UPI002490BC5C|nr:ABC transporter ATP-binding protein [Propioniciclava sinopodophylli]
MSAVSVHARVEARGLDAALDVAPGTVVALVGPNGAGKSSVLQLVGGQLQPDGGTVSVDGSVVSGPRVHVPVHRRNIAVLEQRPLLFEHLTIAENAAFGLRARGVRAAEALARAQRELDAVGCGELAGDRAWEVSGGQAQRIAIARALATDPRLVLLDEPLAALDVSVAPAIRSLLRQRIRGEGRTALLVTHDAVDALTLADELAVMEAGRVLATGPVADLLARPRTPFVADLVGVNLLAGTATGPDVIRLATGDRVVGVPADALGGGAAIASFAPASVAVHTAEPSGSPRNHLRVTVTGIEPRGSLVRLTGELSDGSRVSADLTLAASIDEGLVPGREVWLVVKAAQVALYPR